MRSRIMVALATAAVVVVAVPGGGYAAVSNAFTSKDVKNGSLTGKDVKNGSLRSPDLSTGLRKRINALLKPGSQGPKGDTGPQGPGGSGGGVGGSGGADTVFAGPEWGPIHRNTIKSPDMDLAGGPFVGAAADQQPPFGVGSLSFSVQDGTEKAAFGNQVDFTGDLVSALTQVGFRVFQTGENNTVNARNVPSIAFEVDPSGPGSATAPNFSTLVFIPEPITTTNKWSGYIDGTQGSDTWGLTGSTYNNPATQENCGINGPRCSFAQVKTVLGANATILTAAVQKGRDFSWQGAIDGLRINDEVFDFDPLGTSTTTP